MRRTFAVLLAMLAALVGGSGLAAAQAATPAVPAIFTAYPTLTITITDAGYQLDGAVTAGPVHIHLINATTSVPWAHILISRLPDGADIAQIQQDAADPNSEPPDWLYTNLAGGPDRAQMGHAVDGIVVLQAATYLVADPFSPHSAPFTVGAASANAPAAPADDAAAVTVTMSEFQFAGLPDQVAAGDQIWKVVSNGAQPHELAIMSIPAGMSVAQVIEALSLDDNATPPADLQPFVATLKPTDFTPFIGAQAAATGSTAWISVHLEPGTTYAAICLFPDLETGTPHAMEGMVAIFTAA